MYPVPTFMADWLRRPNRDFAVKALVNGVEYGEDVIVDFSIENSLSLSDELELGTVIPNKLTIRFRMHSQFPPNAKIVPYIALKTDNLTWDEADMSWDEADFAWEGGTTDWIPLGEFYVDNRTKDRDIWTYDCYDRLVFADVEYVSGLNYPTTMQAVWDEICELIGFTYDSSVQIDPTYSIPAGPAGFTCRQVMGFIASANAACAYMGKDGVLRFRKISASAQPVFEMNESDYIRAKQVNPLKTYSRVVIIYDPDDGLYYEAGTGSEAETLYIENPFGTQAMANKILAAINGFSYVPISMPAKGFPHLDQGDIISFETVESMSWEDADMSWDEADFPWDGAKQYQTIILHQVLDFRGGLVMQIEAPSVSEQQSEFPVEGTLTEAVNRLNRNAVRYGKPYYGVTHSRTEGIVVQREDGAAKAVFNADELSFYANGNRALWFDAPNLRWKFSGTLEGVDGTFSGTVQAGQIIGGRIEGAEIYGAEVYGGLITGTTIQTNQSGVFPRIELSATEDFLSAYVSPSNYLRISTLGHSDPVIDFYSGGFVSSMVQYGPTLNLLATNGLHLQGHQYFRLTGPVSLNDGIPLGSISVGNVGTPTVELVTFVLNELLGVLRSMRILQPF